jgi:DNA-binding helix-hairpin-helix protein with protein kinase domain
MSGEKVVRLDDRLYTLVDQPSARGGQAGIYEVREDTKIVVKVYDDLAAYAGEERRIVAMRAMRPLAHPTLPVPLAWPTAVARARNGVFLGYAMRRFDEAEHAEIGSLIDPARRSGTFGERAGWKNLLVVAQNVADVVDRMHRAGLVVGDLSERNIVVSVATGHPTFLDCDSMGFTAPDGHHFEARMQTPGFTAPERAAGPAGLASDKFALAVLVYQLLTEGHHPFEGQSYDRDGWTVQDNIDGGNCYLIDPGRFATAGYPARPGAFILPRHWVDPVVLPHRVAEMARTAFGVGLRRPTSRPSAKDWWLALEDASRHVNTCPQVPGHSYAEHLRACPWCERASRATATLRRPALPLDQVAPPPPPPPPRPLPPVERPLPRYQPQQIPLPVVPPSGPVDEDTVVDLAEQKQETVRPAAAALVGAVAVAVLAVLIVIVIALTHMS